MAGTPICTIDAFGIHRPPLSAVLSYYTGKIQDIYGADTYLGSDSQDGEWIGFIASALDDTNAMCVAAYNSFSPSTAQGVGLSSVVKLNGIKRAIPSFSSAQILLVGVAGTQIVSGVIADENSTNNWSLPALVVIPSAGQIVATATCQTAGAVTAQSGSINKITNPQPGWQTASNPLAATPGAPVELDGQLRLRQSISTMDASTALLEGVNGAVAALAGVARVRSYENTGFDTDDNGLPGNSIAIVVDGGDAGQICDTIWRKKGGCGTYGSVIRTIVDPFGIPLPVGYFPVIEVPVSANLHLKQRLAFTSDIPGMIKDAIAAEINAAGIGIGLDLNRLFSAAYLNGSPYGRTYEITSFQLSRAGVALGAVDIPIDFNAAASCVTSNITITADP